MSQDYDVALPFETLADVLARADVPLVSGPAPSETVPVRGAQVPVRGAKLVGTTLPRLSTEPLRPLTRETSKGYALADFAELVLGRPFLPWQRELSIRALELLPDGSYRYRTVLVIVGRQNGKSEWLKTLALWRMYCDGAELVLGTAQNLQIAREMWLSATGMAQKCPVLAAEIAAVMMGNTDPHLRLTSGARYKTAATDVNAGRGLTVDLCILDEIREMVTWAPWAALSKTTIARARGQIVAASNAGSNASVVMNQLRESALSGRDDTIGLFEWSAEDGVELDDEAAWCQANPGLGFTIDARAIRSALGTDPPAIFRTEVLAQRVSSLDNAIDVEAWKACADPGSGLEAYRNELCVGVDVSSDGAHVSLVAAAKMPDGRVRVQVIGGWWDTGKARAELPGLLEQLKPRRVAWLPGGPAAALAPFLSMQGGQFEVTGDKVSRACMSFSDLVSSRLILHGNDKLLDAQVVGAARMPVGDGYRYARRATGHVDSCYAAAIAVQAVLTMPVPVARPRMLYA